MFGQNLIQFFKVHEVVYFIGADSPHISYKVYEKVITSILAGTLDTFILGNTLDGGFYFFAGKKYIPKNVWTQIEYSTSRTSKCYVRNYQLMVVLSLSIIILTLTS
jgi:glycosyltransferase A (GT-A) superfamily protein (DUF2064 family)